MQTLRQLEFALFDLLIHAKTQHPTIPSYWRYSIACVPICRLCRPPVITVLPMALATFSQGAMRQGIILTNGQNCCPADAFSKFEETSILIKRWQILPR